MGKLAYIFLLLCVLTIAQCKKKEIDFEEEKQPQQDVQFSSNMQSPYDMQYPYNSRFIPPYYKDPFYWKYMYNPFFSSSSDPNMYGPPSYYEEPPYYGYPAPWKPWFQWKSKFWNPMPVRPAPYSNYGYDSSEQ